jgi:hypothetical protein
MQTFNLRKAHTNILHFAQFDLVFQSFYNEQRKHFLCSSFALGHWNMSLLIIYSISCHLTLYPCGRFLEAAFGFDS